MPEGIIIVSTKAHYLCPFPLKPKDVTILAMPDGIIIVSTKAHYLYSFHLQPEGITILLKGITLVPIANY
jgi:hypothetical protein